MFFAPLFIPQPLGMSAEPRWQEHLWEITSRCTFARGQIHQRAPGELSRGHGADSVPITHQRGSLDVYSCWVGKKVGKSRDLSEPLMVEAWVGMKAAGLA